MGRLHIHLGALTLGFALALTVPACQDDTLVAVPDEGERACARPLSYGHWEDGTLRAIGEARHVCLCMTKAEYESKSRIAELNEALLADCELDAAQYDFDWNDCEQDFASNEWVGESGERITWPTTTGVVNPPGATLSCR
ncbi:hypothetical protein [Enhygromyxa salina]|nr:hypothetical protein [Enhygromyxa salina]